MNDGYHIEAFKSNSTFTNGYISTVKKNSLQDFNINNLTLAGIIPQAQGLSKNQAKILECAANPYLLTNQRILLGYIYKNNGVIKAMIDAPVDDAFRGGVNIILDPEEGFTDREIKMVEKYLRKQEVLRAYAQAEKWARLFGGAGLIIEVVGQEPSTEFDIDKLPIGAKINFYPADLWELNTIAPYQYGEEKPYIPERQYKTPYLFYGDKLHKSRVIKMIGVEAPSQLRSVLRGWGLSMLENMTDALANYYELNDLTSNYIDQGKIDIYKIAGLNDAMMLENGMETLVAKMQAANMTKNINNGITIDMEDDFKQKQITFSGLPELREQNRIEMGAATRLPLTKTYGISSPSFNTGEDTLENYNGMIESSIRTPAQYKLIEPIQIAFQVLFGRYPKDIEITFQTLRILNSVEEQDLKSKYLDGLIRVYDRGGLTFKDLIEQINEANIFELKIDPNKKPTEKDFPLPPPQKPVLDQQGDDSKERNKLGK